MATAHRELRITNETKNLSLVRGVVSEFITQSPFSRNEQNRIILAVDEAIANVIEHAYGDDLGLIQITIELDDKRLFVGICDNGERFQPQVNGNNPDIHQHIRLGLKGGLGMFLMRRVMDEVRYSTTSHYNNELDMIKFFPQPENEEDQEAT